MSDSQFGSGKQHNTTHALLTFIDKVAHAVDDVSHTIGVFLDFLKAFDTIDHEILLYKLSYYGIRGRALEWFKDYLADRKQFVSIHGHDSHLKLISCGVPQGSILGPLLFIYISMIFKIRPSFCHSFVLLTIQTCSSHIVTPIL